MLHVEEYFLQILSLAVICNFIMLKWTSKRVNYKTLNIISSD